MFPLFEHVLRPAQSERCHIVQVQHALRHLTLGMQIRVNEFHHTRVGLLNIHVALRPLYVATHDAVLAFLHALPQVLVSLEFLIRGGTRILNHLAAVTHQLRHRLAVRRLGELHLAQRVADLVPYLGGELGLVEFLYIGVVVGGPALLSEKVLAEVPVRVDFAVEQLLIADLAGGCVQDDEAGGAVEEHAVLDFGGVAAVVFADFHLAVERIFGLFNF